MMRKLLLPFVSAGLLMGLVGTAMAQSDVANTKHNLSTGAPGTNTLHLTTGTNEVCVFCHTPHNGATGSVVLWNRTLPTASYTMYSSDTLDNLPAATPQGVSLACLSCHDGTVGFDQLVNFPGSGAGSNAGWVWNGGNNDIVGSFAELGTDLSNDHPISMELDPTNDPGLRTAASVTAAGVPLYNVGGTNMVECGSCHNPHEATLPTFYRIANTNSDLCTTCHIK